MKRKLRSGLSASLLAVAACSPQPAGKSAEAPAAAAPTTTAPKPPKADIPAGDYTLDKHHATLVFRVSHLGFSNYTAAFADFDAKLHFDQNNAGGSTLEATVEALRTINRQLAGVATNINQIAHSANRTHDPDYRAFMAQRAELGRILIETRGALQRILDLGARREDGLERLKAAAEPERAGGSE